MKILIDTCNLNEIHYWIQAGICTGVTTNPIIIKKEGIYNIEEHLLNIARILDHKPLSIQLTSTTKELMMEEAKRYVSLAKNIVIKVPFISPSGESNLSVIYELKESGIKVNATAIMKSFQAIMAAQSGADYISLFWGRIEDAGENPMQQIMETKKWIREAESNAKIIIGSIRSVESLTLASTTLPHYATVPPKVLHQVQYHAMSHKVSAEFHKSALEMAEVKGEVN